MTRNENALEAAVRALHPAVVPHARAIVHGRDLQEGVFAELRHRNHQLTLQSEKEKTNNNNNNKNTILVFPL
jgi:hypothetical protein